MASPRPSRSQPRIEYLGFRNVDGAREYAYAVHAPEGASEFRLRILLAAFATSHVLLQDGPDLCYQQLVRDLEGGRSAHAAPRAIGDGELRAYHDAHTPAARTRFAAVFEGPGRVS